jgi:hemerythrin
MESTGTDCRVRGLILSLFIYSSDNQRMIRLLAWTEKFAVGHLGLDRQHRRLVELINDIDATVHATTPSDRLANLLKVVRVAAEDHLRHEGDLLSEIASGAYSPLRDRIKKPDFLEAVKEAAFDEHIAEHATLLTRLDAISRAPAHSLAENLRAWFVDHALERDAHLKPIFQIALERGIPISAVDNQNRKS